MKAVSYIRVSTDEQATEGHSLDAQRAIIGDFCLNRTWTLVGEYLDAGLSGKDGDRPALQELLADAGTGRFDLVIVHAVDRFYRKLQGLLGALDRLNQAGVGFVSITENLDFTTPWGKLTLALLGTLAEIYIDKLSAETSKGQARPRPQRTLQRHNPFRLLQGRLLNLHRSQRTRLLSATRWPGPLRAGPGGDPVAAPHRERGHAAGLPMVRHRQVRSG